MSIQKYIGIVIGDVLCVLGNIRALGTRRASPSVMAIYRYGSSGSSLLGEIQVVEERIPEVIRPNLPTQSLMGITHTFLSIVSLVVSLAPPEPLFWQGIFSYRLKIIFDHPINRIIEVSIGRGRHLDRKPLVGRGYEIESVSGFDKERIGLPPMLFQRLDKIILSAGLGPPMNVRQMYYSENVAILILDISRIYFND